MHGYSQLSRERMRRQPLHMEEAYQTTPNTPHQCGGGGEEPGKHRKTQGGCCALQHRKGGVGELVCFNVRVVTKGKDEVKIKDNPPG
ncbi:hypothetical protein NQZ68_027551 [Dissostichus eleginoides]|nr:hypothetical protein NQZ68_027551 [Dissostichus eleginoides]